MKTNELLNARLDGHLVKVKTSVKIDETGTGKLDPSYDMNITVDFTGWTVEQVVDVAVKQLVIAFQRQRRTETVKDVMSFNGKTISASDMGKGAKRTVDVENAFAARFAAAGEEEKARLLALLGITK